MSENDSELKKIQRIYNNFGRPDDIKDYLSDKGVDFNRFINRFKPSGKVAREAFLLTGNSKEVATQTIRKDEFDFGDYPVGSVFRFTHRREHEDQTTYGWYAIGKSGKDCEVYVIRNPIDINFQQEYPDDRSRLFVSPKFQVDRIKNPDETSFLYQNGEWENVIPVHLPQDSLEWQKQNPNFIYHLTDIDLVVAGSPQKISSRVPQSPKLAPITVF